MSKREIFIILILAIIALVRFLFFISRNNLPDDIAGQKVSFEGIIIDNPDIRLTSQHLIVLPTNQKTNILVTISKEIDVSYGDKIKINGIIEKPDNFLTQSGKEFDYERYLSNRHIYFVMNYPQIEIISHNNGSWIKSQLFLLRNSFMKNIGKVITTPESNLSNGLLLGSRGGFDNEMRQDFIKTGTIHIVALSGYNISIVSDNLISFFGLFLSKIISTILGVFIIILFIIMTGGTATAIRAGIMAAIILFARITGRNYEASRALILAGILMIFFDPRVVTDMSFQLSFLATGGIFFIMPKIIHWFWFLPIRFKIRETVSTTFSATIAVLPLLLYSTGVLSLVSLPTNILILPIIPITMFFSFLTGIFGFISPILSIPFAYIAKLLLSYILFIINFFASLPFASLNIKSFPLVLTILLYITILWWVFKKQE